MCGSTQLIKQMHLPHLKWAQQGRIKDRFQSTVVEPVRVLSLHDRCGLLSRVTKRLTNSITEIAPQLKGSIPADPSLHPSGTTRSHTGIRLCADAFTRPLRKPVRGPYVSRSILPWLGNLGVRGLATDKTDQLQSFKTDRSVSFTVEDALLIARKR